jgi:RNA polymerase-binding transcription factor DksA
MTALQKLTRKQVRELEVELLAERARLERLLELQSAGDAATAPTVGVVPRVPATQEGGVALALATRTHARHAAIIEALTRLAAGTYGVCGGCNGRIPFGRLLVMPETTRCVTCGPRL